MIIYDFMLSSHRPHDTQALAVACQTWRCSAATSGNLPSTMKFSFRGGLDGLGWCV